MTIPSEPLLKKLRFYVSTSYNCGYLPNKLAQSLVASPHHLINAKTYNILIQKGFRRSGLFSYRPHCDLCNACISVRIVLEEYVSSRSQKRALKQHKTLAQQCYQ